MNQITIHHIMNNNVNNNMNNNVIFSQATPLNSYRRHYLLKDYDYINSPDKLLFDQIKAYFKILKVEKVYNPILYGMYLLSKEELSADENNNNSFNKKKVNEQMLYHATSSLNARSIAKNNIDWRLTYRSRFGRGTCFSLCPKYANRYASQKEVFIIFKVLTKNIEYISVNYGLNIPNQIEDDTTCANGCVIVKYDDFNFYPQYIVYYAD